MPSWQDSLIIGMGLLRRVIGAELVVSPVQASGGIISVQPQGNTGDFPTLVWIRPVANVRFAVDALAETLGLNSAMLIAGQEYPFPLHPAVRTMSFLDAQSSTTTVYLRFLHGR